MSIHLILLIQVFNHTSFRASKILMTLFALDLGASAFTIGLLFAMFSVFPAFLSVLAGRLSDRIGFRTPMLIGCCGLIGGLLLPWALPVLPALFVSATLIGTCYIFYTVTVQHLIGTLGEGLVRTRNYSWYSLCVSVTALIGPVVAGFAIESIGHRSTYLMMALLPLPALAMLVFLAPRVRRASAGGQSAAVRGRVLDLLREGALRRVLITAGILETGSELGNFLLPIYGNAIGLSPSQIGLVAGALAIAQFVARAMMPALVRRSSEEWVLSLSLVLAGSACVILPFMHTFWPLAACAFLMGLGLGCGAPLSMVLVYNRTPDGRTGEAMGLRQTVNKGTEASVPLVFGAITTSLGMLPAFWLVAALLGVGGLLMGREARVQQAGSATTAVSRRPRGE